MAVDGRVELDDNENREENEVAELINLIKNTLGANYQDVQLVGEGAQSYIFSAKWGPEGEETRTIKVDKTSLASPRAVRYRERGCDTLNHVHSLAMLPQAQRNNIVGLVDYRDLTQEHGVTLSVHPFIDGETLEEVVSNGPLEVEKVTKTFSQLLDAAAYYMGHGQVHRDINPTNILLDENGEVSLLDFVNAGEQGNLEPKALPTAGNRWVMDPLLLERFVGEERTYGPDSDFYAMGDNLYYAVTGRHVRELDPDRGILNDALTGESLLDEQGKIDRNKTRKFLDNALSQLPKKARKFRSIIERCMTLDTEKRYSSIEELKSDFGKATSQSFWRSSVGKAIAFSLFGVSSIALALGFGIYNQRQRVSTLEKEVKEAEKYLVASRWDGDGLEYTTNLVNLDVYAFLMDTKEVYTTKPKDWLCGNKKIVDFLRVKPGDQIYVHANVKEIAKPKIKGEHVYTGTLAGKIYFEGYKGKDEMMLPADCDEAGLYYCGGMVSHLYGGFSEDLDVPENISDGLHFLVTEIHAPKEPYQKGLKFANPGSILCRRRIPVVVGDLPEDKIVFLSVLSLDYDNFFHLNRIGSAKHERIAKGLEVEISLPEENYKEICTQRNNYANYFSGHFGLPKGNDTEEKVLQFLVRDKEGKIIHYTFMPAQRKKIIEDTYWWQLAIPTNNFSEKIIRYREKLDRERVKKK